MPGPRTHDKTNSRPVANARPNTLGLGQRELAELLDRFDGPESSPAHARRNFVRWPFRQTSLRVQILHSSGATSEISVACRNISRSGMSILHSAYMHTGTKCVVHLPHPGRAPVPVEAWATRCVHRSGVVHEIGLRFGAPVDVHEILRPDPFTDWFSLERVNPPDLCGTMVYVDESEVDRLIVRHFLRETRIALSEVPIGADALARVDDTTELVVIDYHLGDCTGRDLAAHLRKAGRSMPIIIVTCDPQAAIAGGADYADAFLVKPLSQEMLLRAAGEFLIIRKKSERRAATAGASAAANTQIAQGIASALGQLSQRVEDLVKRNDAGGARTACLQIAGTAGAGGFREIRELAARASDSLTRSKSIAESNSTLRALITACQTQAASKPSQLSSQPQPSPKPANS